MSSIPDLASTPPVEGEHGYFSSKLTKVTPAYLIAGSHLVHYSLAVQVASPPFVTYKGIVPPHTPFWGQDDPRTYSPGMRACARASARAGTPWTRSAMPPQCRQQCRHAAMPPACRHAAECRIESPGTGEPPIKRRKHRRRRYRQGRVDQDQPHPGQGRRGVDHVPHTRRVERFST